MVFGWKDWALVGFNHDGQEFTHYYFLLWLIIGVVVTWGTNGFILTFGVVAIFNIWVD